MASASQQDRGDRQENRDARQAERQGNRDTRQTDRQTDRDTRQDDRQANRDERREDWQDFINENHDDWYDDGWDPGEGWDYMWDNYPVAAALGITAWGINRLGYGMGYEDYSNPYCEDGGGGGGYDYSEPLVSYDESATAAATDPAAAEAAAAAAEPGMVAFEEARTAFAAGDADKALTLLDTTLKTMPRDTVVHEFRSLVLFALKRYPESAAAIYAVLAAGPGWNWTTMIGLYGDPKTYTDQLRALETFAGDNPKSADARFLLGYHYMTAAHKDHAATQFKAAQKLLPDDKLLATLVQMTSPPDAAAAEKPPVQSAVIPEEKVLSVDKLVGTWKSTSKGAEFQLELADDGHFVWSFSRGKEKQKMKGAFAVDQNNLALQPDAGGTMLAIVDVKSPTEFHFQQVGGDKKDPGLDFKKAK